MAQSAVTVRIDSDLKMQFDALCEQFGMSANTAFNIFVKAVIRSRSIPFAIKGSPSAHRAKFKLVPGVADALISFIKEHGIETSRTAFLESMPDEDDRVFYEVSLSVEDSFLVTGNFKHYPQTPKVISPADFLKVMLKAAKK